MGKRKRGPDLYSGLPSVDPLSADEHHDEPVLVSLSSRGGADSNDHLILQVVVGSYERILHGIIARIPAPPKIDDESQCSFADTFLFHAHSSAIRCLAVSPQTSDEAGAGSHKIMLASGGNDERINLFHLSSGVSAPDQRGVFPKPSLKGHTVLENPKNRELGSLLHHSAAVTGLCFPTRSKLLSAAEDNTIAITRTRDWTALSTIKAPMPRAHGRPSGDTAPPGTVPSGINSFAVHPSMKVMLSVSKGERCMRLWNLVKGTKAGVLKFDKEALHVVGGGKWGSADAHVVDWSSSGDEFVIGFERGAIVYSLGCQPKCVVQLSSPSKVHRIRYLHFPQDMADAVDANKKTGDVLAVSTEDGRIIFFSTLIDDELSTRGSGSGLSVPMARRMGQLGGKDTGITSRIKDFVLLPLTPSQSRHIEQPRCIMVTGSSDGTVRIWGLDMLALHRSAMKPGNESSSLGEVNGSGGAGSTQFGRLYGTFETGLRITCLTAFVMSRKLEKEESSKKAESDAAAKFVDTMDNTDGHRG